MIIQVAAGDGFEAPSNADFTIRIASPFTESELLAGDLSVECWRPDGSMVEKAAESDGTDFLLQVTPTMFSSGLWELKPVAVIADKRRTFALSVGMNILAGGVSRYPKIGRATYAFQ